MKCSEFLQELTNYLDGVLDDRTKAELEDHLAWCHNCYVVCDTTKKTIEIYRDSELYELPDDLRNRLVPPLSPSARPTRKPAHAKPESACAGASALARVAAPQTTFRNIAQGSTRYSAAPAGRSQPAYLSANWKLSRPRRKLPSCKHFRRLCNSLHLHSPAPLKHP